MKKEVLLEVDLPRRDAALNELGDLRCLDLNILRGRVTESRARYLVNVSGAARKVEALIRLLRRRGSLIRTGGLKASCA
jgi:acetolactate synthase small subunit